MRLFRSLAPLLAAVLAVPAGTEPAIAPGEPAQAAGAATTSGPASVPGGFATPGAGALGQDSSGTGVPGRSAAAPSIPVQRAEPRFGYEPGHAVEPPATTPRDEPGSAAEQPAGEPPAGLAHEEEFADRGLHSDDVAWSGEGRTLNSTENLAADRFLEHAYAAEEKITPRMRELATDAGGRLYGEEFARKSEESFKRKLSDEIYNEHPGEPLDRQLANMKDAVRYTVGFEDGHYTEGARRVVDGLLNARDEHGQPRYEPVKFKNSWGNDEGYVGINSFWRDNATGQVFELQIHSESSFAAKMETQVPKKTKEARWHRVMALQKEIAAEVSRAYVGRTLKVLVEEPGVARGEADAPDIDGRVYVPLTVPVGEFAEVKITGFEDYDLLALPVGQKPATRKLAKQAQ